MIFVYSDWCTKELDADCVGRQAVKASPAEFLNRVMDLSLSAADVTTLAQRSEGWIAGLQMAAFSTRDRRDVSNFICTFPGSHACIIDYLMEEVLQPQPPEMQTFLLYIAILDRMCAADVGNAA